MRVTGHTTTKRAEEDLERALKNWARWVVSDKSALHSSFPTEKRVEGPRPYDAPIPIINGEAVEMDAIVEALPVRYAEVIRVWYVQELDPVVAARRCRIQTVYNRLEEAWALIRRERSARRDAAARTGAHYHEAVVLARAARSVC
jgi:hypothetical protein